MKKLSAFFLVLIMILTGCGGMQGGNADSASTDTAAGISTSEASHETDQSLSETESTAEKGVNDCLMDSRIPAGEQGNVWYIPNHEVESMQTPELYRFNGNLLLVSNEIGDKGSLAQLKLISLSDGSLLAETVFTDSGFVTVQTGDGLIGICDSGTGLIRIFDENLKIKKTYELEPDGENWYLSRDLKTLYIFRYNIGVAARNLEDGTETVLVTNAADVYVREQTLRYVIFVYRDLASQCCYTLCLDLETGKLEQPPEGGEVSAASRVGDTWLLGDQNEWGKYYLMSGGETKTLTWKENLITLLEPGGSLMTKDASGCDLKLYDAEGKFLSECSIEAPDGSYTGADFIFSDFWNGYFFLCYENGRYGKLMFWDPEKTVEGTDFVFDPDAREPLPAGTLVGKALYDRAASLSKRFGVDIRIADQCQLDYSHYQSYAVSNEEFLNETMDMMEEAFSRYPEGFLQQLPYGNIREIRIELIGGLSPKAGANVGGSASAFTQEMGNYYLMAVDVYTMRTELFYHEITHIIDRHLAWDAGRREDELFSEERWMELQPEGFDYAWSYGEIPPDVQKFGSTGYFISDYALTYPTEDRAMMMQTAMENLPYSFTHSEGLCRKLQYYSECIRDSFDSSEWPGTTAWEQVLR